MNVINRLKRDHSLLRAKSTILASTLHMGEVAWFIAREVSFTYAQQLEEHARRETRLLDACHDHAAEQAQLKAINRLFAEEPRCSLGRIRPLLNTFMAALQHGMGRQEVRLFPMFEDRVALDDLLRRQDPLKPSELTETMTVQEVAHRYPKTRAVLDGLFIDRRFEGYDCLGEVAWRHGMDGQALLALLGNAVGRGALALQDS